MEEGKKLAREEPMPQASTSEPETSGQKKRKPSSSEINVSGGGTHVQQATSIEEQGIPTKWWMRSAGLIEKEPPSRHRPRWERPKKLLVKRSGKPAKTQHTRLAVAEPTSENPVQPMNIEQKAPSESTSEMQSQMEERQNSGGQAETSRPVTDYGNFVAVQKRLRGNLRPQILAEMLVNALRERDVGENDRQREKEEKLRFFVQSFVKKTTFVGCKKELPLLNEILVRLEQLAFDSSFRFESLEQLDNFFYDRCLALEIPFSKWILDSDWPEYSVKEVKDDIIYFWLRLERLFGRKIPRLSRIIPSSNPRPVLIPQEEQIVPTSSLAEHIEAERRRAQSVPSSVPPTFAQVVGSVKAPSSKKSEPPVQKSEEFRLASNESKVHVSERQHIILHPENPTSVKKDWSKKVQFLDQANDQYIFRLDIDNITPSGALSVKFDFVSLETYEKDDLEEMPHVDVVCTTVNPHHPAGSLSARAHFSFRWGETTAVSLKISYLGKSSYQYRSVSGGYEFRDWSEIRCQFRGLR